MKNGKAKSDINRKSSHLGNKINDAVRKQAIKLIPKGEKIQEQKELLGWKWIKKDKITKHVHPNKIEAYLLDGWTLTASIA